MRLKPEGYKARASSSLSPPWPVQEHPPPKRNESLCFVLHLQGVELARSTHCFTHEDITGRAPVPSMSMGTNMGMRFMWLPLVDQKHRSGQMEALVQTCSVCRQDLHDMGARFLPCQHLLCKGCFQGLIQELRQVAKVLGSVPDGKYKSKAPLVPLLPHNWSLSVS